MGSADQLKGEEPSGDRCRVLSDQEEHFERVEGEQCDEVLKPLDESRRLLLAVFVPFSIIYVPAGPSEYRTGAYSRSVRKIRLGSNEEEFLTTNNANSIRNLENLHHNSIFPLSPELQEELRDSGYSKNVPTITQPFAAHQQVSSPPVHHGPLTTVKSMQHLSSTAKEDFKDPTSFRRRQHIVRPASSSSSSYGRISTAHRFDKVKITPLEDLHPAVAGLWRAKDPLYYKHKTFKVTDGFNSSKDLRTFTIEAMRASI
eukprot:766957-Hanusia_phi.AAC.2